MRYNVGDIVKVKSYSSTFFGTLISRQGDCEKNYNLTDVKIIGKSETDSAYLIDVTDCKTGYRKFESFDEMKSYVENFSIHPNNIDMERIYFTILEEGVVTLVKSVDKIY